MEREAEDRHDGQRSRVENAGVDEEEMPGLDDVNNPPGEGPAVDDV